MGQEDLNKFRPEVVFVAEGYEEAENRPLSDVVSSRNFVTSALGPQNGAENPEYREIIDLKSAVTEFLFKLELSGKFNVLDRNGTSLGTPKQMPEGLADEICSKTINAIGLIHQDFQGTITISELLDGISDIIAFVSEGEVIDISIFTK